MISARRTDCYAAWHVAPGGQSAIRCHSDKTAMPYLVPGPRTQSKAAKILNLAILAVVLLFVVWGAISR
jgi:hypothetical protein